MNEDKKPILIKNIGLLLPHPKSSQKYQYGLFRCHCGKEFETQIRSVEKGSCGSCGCFKNKKHGLKNHRLYGTWKAMVRRTTSTNDINYKNYGGRGISICERWKDVKNFINDMFPTFIEGTTLDRINNNGDYELKNCRWETQVLQSRNTRVLRTNNTSMYRGVSRNGSGWMARISINYKLKYIGTFGTAEEAGYAYDKYVIDNNLEHTTNGLIKGIPYE